MNQFNLSHAKWVYQTGVPIEYLNADSPCQSDIRQIPIDWECLADLCKDEDGPEPKATRGGSM